MLEKTINGVSIVYGAVEKKFLKNVITNMASQGYNLIDSHKMLTSAKYYVQFVKAV